MHKAYLEALEAYQEQYQVGRLQTIIHKRSAYGEANANGLGVVEYENQKAKKEIKNFVKEIMEVMTSVPT